MPQDTRRSAVYRSFLTCNDPRGVIECNTIRKSETDSKKMRNHGIQQALNKEKVVDIMDVSRGAERLGEAIESFSSSKNSFNGKSANDLLKGALDLQESLVMLGKLQQVSRNATKSKKMYKENPEGERLDAVIDSRRSYSFGDYGRTTDFERPRMSAEGSSRNFVYRTNIDFSMDFPSSSSSQSSIFHSHSPDHPPPSKVRREKPKCSNLIAKLMGLEEEEPNAAKPRVYKQMVKDKLMSRSRDRVDIDLPTSKKSQFMMVRKMGRDRSAIEEMTEETLQFEAAIRGGRKSIDDREDSSDVCSSGRSLGVEGDPPIVIMKSLQAVNIEDVSKKIPKKMREEISPTAVEVRSGTLKVSEANGKPKAGRKSEQKLGVDKETKHPGELPAKCVKKSPSIEDKMPSSRINHCKRLAPRTPKKEACVSKMESIPDVKVVKPHEPDKAQDPRKTARGSNVSKHRKTVASTKLIEPRSPQYCIPKPKKKGKSQCQPSDALVELKNNGNIPGSSKNTTGRKIVHGLMDGSQTYVSDALGAEANSYGSCVSTMEDKLKHIEDRSSILCPNLDHSISSSRYVFLDQEKELLVTSVSSHKPSHAGCLPDSEILCSSLLLDRAKEILEHKNLSCTRTVTPPLEKLFRIPKRRFSLEQLVREISDGIEDLRNYSKGCSNNAIHLDAMYPMLERDVLWNGEATGAWDSGFTVEQVDEVVKDVEELVLSDLVDDVIRFIESEVS